MSPSIDVQILDDGTGLASVSFVDPKGNSIPAPAGSTVAFTSSDSNVVVTANTDGLSASIAPAGPLVNDVVITATATLADGVTTFTDSKQIDVIADAAKPAGISLAVSASS